MNVALIFQTGTHAGKGKVFGLVRVVRSERVSARNTSKDLQFVLSGVSGSQR